MNEQSFFFEFQLEASVIEYKVKLKREKTR